MIYTSSTDALKVSANDAGLKVTYLDQAGKEQSIDVDMVILALAMVPGKGAADLAGVIGIDLDERGFFKTLDEDIASVESSREGVFIAGTAEGPKDTQTSVVQAEAAVGKAMAFLETHRPETVEAAGDAGN
jgi:heterodisulfide reductase subunit A